MLDQDIIEQLKSAFASLEKNIELQITESSHEDQSQLLDMLEGLTKTSDKISIRSVKNETTDQTPRFTIFYDQKPTGIFFKGIPGGHEFTSLILAILNSDGKGKLPDQILIQRIKSLKGPVRVRTFISLSCENCPDVVQAMNLMATLHSDFQHEMVDGAYAQDEINRLNIQGVPCVIVNDTMIHSGRINFLDLLKKLEDTFGIDDLVAKAVDPKLADLGEYDVVVIGGGPAGASAAIYSVRKGLKTALLAEKFGGQVQDTKGIENLISVPYTEGPILASKFIEHMAVYSIETFEHRRVRSISKEKIKKIILESGEEITANTVIIATGAKWRELNIPGEKEYLGQGVAFCPHCDGPFYKGKEIAVIGGGNSGVEAAIDLAGIVKEVTLIEFGSELKADQVLVNKLKSLTNTKIITNAKTTTILGDGKRMNGLKYQDRTSDQEITLPLEGVFIQIGLLPNTQFLKETLALNKMGEIVIDEKNRTSEKGIYAAGDVTTIPYKQIIISMGEGAKAALSAFEDRMKDS